MVLSTPVSAVYMQSTNKAPVIQYKNVKEDDVRAADVDVAADMKIWKKWSADPVTILLFVNVLTNVIAIIIALAALLSARRW